MAVTVTTAVVPAVPFLVPVPVGREAVAGHWGQSGGARNMASFWRNTHEKAQTVWLSRNGSRAETVQRVTKPAGEKEPWKCL